MKLERSNNIIQFFSRILAVFIYFTFILIYVFKLNVNNRIISLLVIVASISGMFMMYYNRKIKNTRIIYDVLSI